MEKINLMEKFALFQEHWSPRILGEVNDAHVKIARLKGEFVWHSHENEDEMFLILKGELTIRFEDGDVALGEGECIIIPHGVGHMPVAKEEVLAMLIEPKSTLNTGDAVSELTVSNPKKI